MSDETLRDALDRISKLESRLATAFVGIEQLALRADRAEAQMVEHEKQVRERVAGEILAAERALAASDPATEDALIVSGIHARGLIQAARIARGEQ